MKKYKTKNRYKNYGAETITKTGATENPKE